MTERAIAVGEQFKAGPHKSRGGEKFNFLPNGGISMVVQFAKRMLSTMAFRHFTLHASLSVRGKEGETGVTDGRIRMHSLNIFFVATADLRN